MDILRAFRLNGEDHEVNVQGTYENPLFQANQIGKILGVKNISDAMSSYQDKEDKGIGISYTIERGLQKTLFLTETGLYRFLFRSNKPIAKTFQTWVCGVIKEIRITGAYRLSEEREIEKELLQSRSAEQKHQSTLMSVFDEKNVVYIIKLRNEDENRFWLKIGSSQNIKQRVSAISSKYCNSAVLLKVFECNSHMRCEQSLLKNAFIKNLFKQFPNTDNLNYKETFLVTPDEYEQIVKIADLQVKEFRSEEISNRVIAAEEIQHNHEMEKIRAEQQILILTQQTLREKRETMRLELDQMERRQTLAVIDSSPVLPGVKRSREELNDDEASNHRSRNDTRSPFVWQYDPVTLQPIKMFDSMITVFRTREFDGVNGPMLKKAVKYCTTYHNFRWAFSDREIAAVAPILEPTVQIRKRQASLVAMLDVKQTYIVMVYPDQKTATESRKPILNTLAAISKAMKEGTQSAGFFWRAFENCPEEMRVEYLRTNSLPEKTKSSIGVYVHKLNSITGEVVRVFNSILEVTVHCQMSRICLKKYAANGEVYNGFRWKIINGDH